MTTIIQFTNLYTPFQQTRTTICQTVLPFFCVINCELGFWFSRDWQ